MTNEAAERLHESEHGKGRCMVECSLQRQLAAALAAERKATVERIRAEVQSHAQPDDDCRLDFDAILDAEAAR